MRGTHVYISGLHDACHGSHKMTLYFIAVVIDELYLRVLISNIGVHVQFIRPFVSVIMLCHCDTLYTNCKCAQIEAAASC